MPDTSSRVVPAGLNLSSATAVEAALRCPALVPPPAGPALAAGATADLRAAMARFSAGPAHERRRAAVVRAIDGLDHHALRSDAGQATLRCLTGAPVDVLADGRGGVGFRVPVAVLAEALGIAPEDLDRVVDDVGAVVAVIGRGDPVSPDTDRAANRLRRRFRDHPAGDVAAVSVLYQAYDATAALIAAAIVARQKGGARRPAVVRTVRVAREDADLAGVTVPAGAVVTLGLEDGDLEFGAGPHACPGRAVAEALAGGVLDALAETGYRLVGTLMETGPDGRPRTLPMEVLR